MNRTRKFKVWDNETKAWVHDWPGSRRMHLLDVETGVYFDDLDISNGEANQERNKERYNVLDYTAMHDKNGKEISEGDILSVRGFDDWFDELGHDYNVVVVFNCGGFFTKTWKVIHDTTSEFMGQPLWKHVEDGCEVIGNIFENSELLEE